MDFEDLPAPDAVGRLDGDAAVEAPGAQQRGVEDVGAVRRGQHDDGLGAFEAVHFGQDLVERLLALVVGAGDRDGPLARASDRVELVDEDDRRGRLLGLGEQVAHARRADADDRLDELGGRDREESRVGLAGDGAREQRLAGAGGAREQDPVRHPPAQAPVALGVAQEVDDLGQFGLGLADAGDVREGHADLFGIDAPGLAAPEVAEASEPASRFGGPAEDQDEDPDDQERRTEAEQQLGEQRLGLFGRFGVDDDVLARCSRAASCASFQKLGTWVANSLLGSALLLCGRIALLVLEGRPRSCRPWRRSI